MGASDYDIIIVGAGVGGLTLASKLHRGGLRVLVLEKNPSVGGWAQSIEKDGFLCERGPNSTFAKPAVNSLIDELDLNEDLCAANTQSKKRFVLLRRATGHSSLVQVPDGLKNAIKTPLLTWSEKLRIFAEPFMPISSLDDESVASFASRRLGKGFTNNVLAPALSGIWAADINSLSARSALGKLFDFERGAGSILRGALRARKEPRTKRGQTISFKLGMQQLAQRLAGSIPEDALRCGCSVRKLKFDQNGVRVFVSESESTVEQIGASQVVLTADSQSVAKLIEDLAPALAERIEAIPYAPMGVMHVSWNADALDNFPGGFGFLATPARGKPLLGTLFNSACFPGRSPEGKLLFTCFVGGAVNPELSDVTDEAVSKMVLSELSGVLGARVPPKVINTFVHKRAIPNYPVGHFELQQKIQSFHENHRSVWLLANWIEGLGVADRIEKAGELAEKLLVEKAVERREEELAVRRK